MAPKKPPVANPMAMKVARLTEGNNKLQAAAAALQKQVTELKQEREAMVDTFREELRQIGASIPDVARHDAAAEEQLLEQQVLCSEAEHLREELQRLKRASKLRLISQAREVDGLRGAIEFKDGQLVRVRRALQAISAATDADLGELSRESQKAAELKTEADQLEVDCLRLHCQAQAWELRIEESQRQAAEAALRWEARQGELAAEVETLQAELQQSHAQIDRENALCERLKAPETSLRVQERGCQDAYISDREILQRQVEALTAQLQKLTQNARDADLAASEPGEGAAVEVANRSWLSALCLRPDWGEEDPSESPRFSAQRP